jgi:hypothetical protein
MRRLLTVSLALMMLAAFSVAPAAAGEKLGVTIITVEPELFAGAGTFTVEGEAGPYLCPSGTWPATNTVFYWQTEDRFRLTQDKVFSCDTGETFVLELRAKIIANQGVIPGHGTWKLRDSTGFDPALVGKGTIGAGPSDLSETHEGLLKFG